MEVEKLGAGYPVVSIVACLHGDEPGGKRAIERFLGEQRTVEEAVQFVTANTEAMEIGDRAVDADLNRSFPGDERSDQHEERVAHELLKTLQGSRTLDIHATNSTRRPFAISVHFTLETAHLLRATGLDTVVDTSAIPDSDGGLVANVPGVSVECGHKDDPETTETAYEVLENFLAANGALGAAFDYPADPQVFRIYEKIDHPTDAATLSAADFELVEEGTEYLTVDGRSITAEQDFYPVLASDRTDSYDFVGFKAKNVGALSDVVHRS
jgi:predicted deacylase